MKTASKFASDRREPGPDLSRLRTPIPVQRRGTRRAPRVIRGLAAVAISAAVAVLGFAASAVRADSVWPATGRAPKSMYADHKAGATGDILTIVVAESVAAQNSQSKKSSRESSIEDTISKFIYSGLAAHRGELPGMGETGKSTYAGGGDISNTQSLSSRAAVLVADVLPNGNLVIEGVRVVRVSGETQYVVLHGVVRPEDITRDNTVISSSIADARVEFYSEGALTDAQKRGWLAKMYEKLRPF